MSPPTLFQLAAKSLAQVIHEEKIPFDFHLDTKSSNAVFRELLELDPNNVELLKSYKNQLLKLTELDLRKCRIDEEGVSDLNKFNLISLEFGDLCHLITKFPDPIYRNRIDIVSFLERAVNTNSREMMIHLGFSGKEEFMSGWEEKISKLLPSLQSMKIISGQFIERFLFSNLFSGQTPFSNLCNSFPNLRVLDISSARGLSSLNGIKHLKNLQELVMRNVIIENVDGYKELSELKNLRILDVSVDSDPFLLSNPIRLIGSLLAADVQMEKLEFLDCSMTVLNEQELRKFVEHHPTLKTVVAITPVCDHVSIPTIDLLNFNSTTSLVKCLKYALSNDRDKLAQNCVHAIARKLNTNHEQLNDSEIRVLLNALCYVLRESKNKIDKYWAVKCFVESNFFETERFFSSFSLEIPGIVGLIIKSSETLEVVSFPFNSHPSITSILNQIVNFLRFGKPLQDSVLSLIMEKTVELSCLNSGYDYVGILIRASRLISVDQHTSICNNTKVFQGLFEISDKLINREPLTYQQVMELIVSYMKQASEDTLKFLVSNCQAVEKCVEQIMMLSRFSTKDMQKHLLHFLMIFSSVMSDEQLKRCYGGETVFRLISVINTTGLRNPFERTRAIMFCSILSLLLAKNLTEHRAHIKTTIKEFNDSWGQWNIPNCQKMSARVLNAIITSRHSTDESICLCLISMSTFIYAEGYEANGCLNYIKATSKGIRDNLNMPEYTREAAELVLYEMENIENKYRI
ncbi:hypothetical protein B9Z55_004890 [Caenorhabditis nigoni]|uniref:Zer-1-like leucine-rich repeats region domain-containing protein n=1 Tax=Caenorhabditis nigoni TaxID=1611254 RepID=A0A2G5UYG0_9PELO|nr:hypothetical protein B9Z55_004890 [Caenorhabditis nigoni]